jgi:acetyl esterase/lipase
MRRSSARDAGEPRLVFQLLVYPRTAPDEDSPSHHALAEGYMLTRKVILWFHDHYRANDSDREDFRYAPLIAKTSRACRRRSSSSASTIRCATTASPTRSGCASRQRGRARRLRRHGASFLLDGWRVDAGRRAMAQATDALRRAFEGANK